MRKNKNLKLLAFVFILSLTVITLFPNTKPNLRLSFITDIHFDEPRGGHKYGGVELDGDTSDFKIPILAKKSIESVKPDIIFDTGDLTAHSGKIEFRAYSRWMKDLPAPVYAVTGNHDRQHHSLKHPYGTGFYSECGFNSATRTYKMGNLVFIMVSDDHKWEHHPLTDVISDQKFKWIEKQLRKFSKGNNNIFLFGHYPIYKTVAWSDTWYGMLPPWKRISDQYKKLLYKYEEHIVAHISGHLHTGYDWKDTPEDSTYRKGCTDQRFNDGDEGLENVGHFVSGPKINQTKRNHPPFRLPEMYFLNPQALAYTHGGPFRAGGCKCINKGAVYYADLTEGTKYFNLITREINSNTDVDTFKVKTDYKIQLKNKNMNFIASDLGIRKKDSCIQITENNWFKVKQNCSGEVIFQKRWKKKINFKGVRVISEHGNYGNIQYKISSDSGATWTKWKDRPVGKFNLAQIKIKFKASKNQNMVVKDIKIRTGN